MDQQTLEKFKNLLLEKRLEVLDRIAQLREATMQNSEESGGNRTGIGLDLADQGSDQMEREKAFLFLSREEKYLQQIQDALNRIELGEYGVCRVCGNEIDPKRLEIVPTTRICVPCKNKEAAKAS
jgi:RNA polymerase-binding protein DksA